MIPSKLFYNETSGTFHATLREARHTEPNSIIYRVWMEEGVIIGRVSVYMQGLNLISISEADSIIYKDLKQNTKQ